MAPPKFGDLGKQAKDLFTEDYVLGETKVTLKTKAPNGLNLKVEGKQNASNVSGLIEAKFAPAKGISIKKKFTTLGQVTGEYTHEGLPVGAKHTLEYTFAPNGGFKSFAFKGELAKDHFYLDGSYDGKNLAAGGVYQYGNYLFGVKGDLQGTSLTATRIAAGYAEGNMTINSVVTSQGGKTDIEGSVHLVHSPTLETAVKFSWRKDSSDTGFEVGSKFKISDQAWLKSKVDKNFNVGLSYGRNLRAGVGLILSTKINAGNLSTDAHQFGLGLTFEN